MTENNDTGDGSWATAYLENTIDDMLAGHGMDPERAVITDVEYADGELAVRAVDRPAATAVSDETRTIAKAKAIVEWHESDDEFVEVSHDHATAAVFGGTETGEVAVSADGEARDHHIDEGIAAIIAAAWAFDGAEDENDD